LASKTSKNTLNLPSNFSKAAFINNKNKGSSNESSFCETETYKKSGHSNYSRVGSMRALSPKREEWYLDPVLTLIAENLNKNFRKNLQKSRFGNLLIKEDSLAEFATSRSRYI